MKHPFQAVEIDPHGTLRFRCNAIVRYLLDAGPFDMNHITMLPVDNDDLIQFVQLIGYSVSGFGDLSYVPDDIVALADALEPQS